MKLSFRCGVCAKDDTLDLIDKNKVYLIGRDFEGLDMKLCTDERSTLSRIQAHIKWDRNSWRIYDGIPPDTMGSHSDGINKPASFAGTFLKRNNSIRFIEYDKGEELRVGDTVYFVITNKADKYLTNTWLKAAGPDTQTAFYKYDGFKFKGDNEYFDGFKYRFDVISDEKVVESKTNASNIFLPDNFSKDLEPGKLHHNSCIGLDIRSSTEADLETQRDYWIPQFNSILNRMLAKQKDYLLILLGDGAYVCFLGNREHEDINFSFATKFFELLNQVNIKNMNEKVAPWKVRVAVHNGKDLLSEVNIAGQKSLNVYGNTITSTARLMSHAKSEPDEIIVGIPFHQEFNNQKYYKVKFTQTPGQTTDKNGVLHHYYIYKPK